MYLSFFEGKNLHNTARLFLRIFIIILMMISDICHGAVSISGTPVLDFGTIMQNDTVSVIKLDTSGNIVSSQGIYKPQGTSSADAITYQTGSLLANTYDYAVIYPENAVGTITIPGCSAEISDVTPSTDTNDFSVRGWLSLFSCRNLSSSKTVNYGATLTLTGLCEVGEYEGSINIPGTTETCSVSSGTSTCNGSCGNTPTQVTHTVSFKVKIDAPLEVVETQSMFFGSIMRRDGGTVVIGTEDNLIEAEGVTIFNTSAVRSGIFRVSGVGGKPVNIVLPTSATISYGSDTMTVNNFTTSAQTVELPNLSETEALGYFSVGATLTVRSDQTPGTYNGTYSVQVNY